MTYAIHSPETLRQWRNMQRQNGKSVALIPTMGALHAGHLELVKAAQKQGCATIVSIFVNPLQFGAGEDLDRYPRPIEADRAALESIGADALYLPEATHMYPDGFQTVVQAGSLADGLCGARRPGHFNGVCTVVAKLFNQAQPDYAYFGEKDYQQLCIIRRMVTDLDFPLHIMPVATIRETDGLAKSSRNQYLTIEERAIAPVLYATLRQCAARIQATEDVSTVLDSGQAALIVAGFSAVDYLSLCDAHTLEPQAVYQSPARLLVAVHLGKTRLIDNISVEQTHES